jgi:uncharacterized membrane protein YoaK (UPF0700 family)
LVTTAVIDTRATADSTVGLKSAKSVAKTIDPFLAGLAFLSGWADVMTWKKFGVYANMMTGCTINLARALVTQQLEGVSFFASMIVAYTIAWTLFSMIILKYPERFSSPSRAAVPLILPCFIAADAFVIGFPDSRFPALFLSIGFAALNAVSLKVGGHVTQMVTGHLQRIGVDLADSASGNLQPERAGVTRSSAVVYVSFFCGVLASSAILKLLETKGFEIALRVVTSFTFLGTFISLLLVWQGGR